MGSHCKARALGLFSGGLDSTLAAILLVKQGIDVIGLSFVSPFFGSKNAKKCAETLGVPLRVLDITEKHLEIVKAPRYGYGSCMNPCIDCHALMLREALTRLAEEGASFVFTGEVLNERPMSQNRRALEIVARESGCPELVLRPLSARLLPPTRPEIEGVVKRELLLDIEGRSRKRQMELARIFGLKAYPAPAGGCLLTDPGFSKRLEDLFERHADWVLRDIELLKAGRHFRISPGEKLVVGRNEAENDTVAKLSGEGDVTLFSRDYMGPIGLIPGGASGEATALAARIVTRYSDAPKTQASVVLIKGEVEEAVEVEALEEEILKKLRI